MNKIIFLFTILCSLQIAKAQKAPKNQNVYFLKNNGKEVELKDSADYIRVIQEPDSGEVKFNLLEFYVDGKKKTIGKVSAFEPRLMLEGAIMRFDKDGKRKQITTYEKGVPVGMSYEYFSNGKMHRQIEYLPYASALPMNMPGVNLSDIPFNIEYKVIYLADSLCIEQVKDGNGHMKKVEIFEKNTRAEEGDYKEGFKHGIWSGSETAYGTSFVETYDMGKLISGESTKEGKKYPYTTKDSFPTFKGGIQKFYEYVSYGVRYPMDAARDRITGTVILNFTVERDGTVTEVDVKQSVYPSLDDEAKRIVRFSPKWIPAAQRGVPVRVRYSIPIKFSMP